MAALAAQLLSDPPAFRVAELPRMERVAANFRLYKIVEIALLACGTSSASAKRSTLSGSACSSRRRSC